MKKLAERALTKLAQDGTKKRRAFGVFMKLLIADGLLVRLPDALERHYPAWNDFSGPIVFYGVKESACTT